MGYHIDQYTALDGYSTDWPGISSILSDISIPDEVNAADIERRVNYRVQNGLETKITTIFNLIKSELGDFSSATQTLVQNALPDWKAPERGGTPKYGEAFENYVIRGLDEPSDHLNITEIYTDSDTRPLTGERYILENFVGKQTTSSKLLKFAASFSSLSAEPDNAFTLNQSVAKSASSTTADDFSNFTDGSFEDLADLRQEILAVDFTPTDDEAINNWVAQARDASKIVTVLWDVVGNVKLVDDGTNAQVELVQTADTSLGQVLSFNDSSPQSIEFDLSVETVGEGDRLQVVFDNSVLTDLDLSTLPTNGHYSVSLAGLTSQFGELSFRLTGPQDSPAIVKLDNLSVLFKDTPPVNHPPTLNQAIASQTATEDAAFSFTFDANTFIDIDAGDSLNYKATLANGNPLPAWLNFNAATRTFSGTPTNSDVGTLSLKLTATDIAGVSSEDIFNLEVIKIDNPPIIGTSGRDVLTGTSKSDRIIGLQGGDTLTGGGGNDQFVYIDIRDRGDTITDFEVGKDKIVFTQLLDSLVTGGYNGVNAIADGYVKVVQGTSASNFSVQIDADGPTGKDIFRPLITVNLASSGSLNNPNNFVF
ncbi:MAG: putative Ig domain-containing protein [Desmonostoc vinosum HA7617-LM4]|nr:putative Ig domain-containing protein [Desmonostoc vinosum HA7617-LM4]